MLREANYRKHHIINTDICIKINGILRTIRKVKNSSIYWSLLDNSSALVKPAAQDKWEREFDIPVESFKQIYTLPFKCCKYTKYQSFQYKIIHRIIACNYWLLKMNIHSTGQCSFCTELDNIEHFFIKCCKTLLFWKMFNN
jgi:hypothetical protein